MTENKDLKNYTLKEVANLKVLGRTTDCLEPLTLFWTASGIELEARGSELWIEVEVDYSQYESWISILVNDAPVSRQMLIRGRYWICCFRGMNPETVKNIKILKEIQPMPADPECSLKIHGIQFDGEFLPVPEKPYKIEFVGDSITSGEGLIGSVKEEDWIPMLFSCVPNYATLTGNCLNAEIRIISQCGWGVYCGWDNNPHSNLPSVYEKICGPLEGQRNEGLGAFLDHDFTSWQPDVIVVNLGTNDHSAFYTPEWVEEATGRVYKLHLEEENILEKGNILEEENILKEENVLKKEDEQLIETAVTNFLELLRKCNPSSHILWAYGALNDALVPCITRGIQVYQEKSGDTRVSFLLLPPMPEEMTGARFHPGVQYHQKMADCLKEALEKLLEGKNKG